MYECDVMALAVLCGLSQAEFHKMLCERYTHPLM